jgi:hypothetical protein
VLNYFLWILLNAIESKGLKELKEFGDSKPMVDTENNKCSLEKLLLDPIMVQVQELKGSF